MNDSRYVSRFSILILFTIGCFVSIQAQESNNFILLLDNDSIGIDLNTELEHTLSSGEKIKIKLIQPSTLNFSDEMFSFKYPTNLSASSSMITDQIEQTMVMSVTGNGFMIQKYIGFEPDLLTDIVLREVTKESISYGYKNEESDWTRTLESGHVLTGKQSKLTYQGDETVYTVASYSSKDSGLLIVLLEVDRTDASGLEAIDLFLKTLKIN